MATQPKWQLSGDYFENCNCSVVCPCLVSKAAGGAATDCFFMLAPARFSKRVVDHAFSQIAGELCF